MDDVRIRADFSAVMSMNDKTVGLLKSNGQTLQVKAGDYLEDHKFTVAKIGAQAIWITDQNDREIIARDTTFETASGKRSVSTETKR